MNPLDDSGAIFRYHRDMMATHGTQSSLALGWLTDHDQQIRFEKLSQVADLNDKIILDAGCGYGDLYRFLSAKYSLQHYYGVEQIPELVDEAIKRYQDLNNTTFISRNFLSGQLPVADYVFASGSLNYGSGDAGFIFKAIELLFDHCQAGLAFNLLKSVPQNGLLVAYNPELIISHCNTLCKDVRFKDGYADDDYTIFMYR